MNIIKNTPLTLPNNLKQQLAPILPFMSPYIDQKLITEFYQGHVAAITGAGSGIGRALALNLASLGCHLALSDINLENLAETKERLLNKDNKGIKITTTQLDVANKDAVFAWANQVMQDHGKVNFIFNNAGVALASTVEGESIEEIEWVMNVNFWGMVYGTKAFLPLIKQSVNSAINSTTTNQVQHHTHKKAHGHIINISSLFGIVALPAQSAYNASKFAIRGFNESLRQELDIQRCGVSLTSVHPGGIKTNIANNAQENQSVRSLGMTTGVEGLKKINKLLKFEPDTAAKVILMAAANNQSRSLVGDDAKIIDFIQRVFPSNYGPVMNRAKKVVSKARRHPLMSRLR